MSQRQPDSQLASSKKHFFSSTTSCFIPIHPSRCVCGLLRPSAAHWRYQNPQRGAKSLPSLFLFLHSPSAVHLLSPSFLLLSHSLSPRPFSFPYLNIALSFSFLFHFNQTSLPARDSPAGLCPGSSTSTTLAHTPLSCWDTTLKHIFFLLWPTLHSHTLIPPRTDANLLHKCKANQLRGNSVFTCSRFTFFVCFLHFCFVFSSIHPV